MVSKSWIITGVSVVVLFVLGICSAHVVSPGHRGVRVTFGTTNESFVGEGLSFTNPFSTITDLSVQQETQELKAECFSSDLQQVDAHVRILFRVPQQSVVNIFKNYKGDPFKSLIEPRVQEAVKEATASRSAEAIVKNREQVKAASLEMSRQKLGNLIEIDDLVIQDLALSHDLERAIEQKMVQEQEAAKARFVQQQAEVDAKTAVIRAQGEAQAIKIRGDALRQNPSLIQLQLVEKWDGHAPKFVGGGSRGAGIILPVNDN